MNNEFELISAAVIQHAVTEPPARLLERIKAELIEAHEERGGIRPFHADELANLSDVEHTADLQWEGPT
jgi:hypothetical protein